MHRPMSSSALLSEVLSNPEPLRAAITASTLCDEPSAVRRLLEQAPQDDSAQQQAVQALALQLVNHVREQRRRAGGVDALMNEYALDSREGLALMCLAEALLRIPDRASARRLLVDQLSHADWRRHLGHSPSMLVNGATLGLLLAANVLKVLKVLESDVAQKPALSRLLAKAAAPVIHWAFEVAMRRLGRQFIQGQHIEAALAVQRSRYRYSYDMLGEAALTAQDAANYQAAYATAIDAIGRAAQGAGIIDGSGISIKLSALHPRYCRAQRARVMGELLPRVKSLAVLAKKYQIGFTIDAEEAERLELSLDILQALALDPDLSAYDGLGIAVQAYQKRAPYVMDYLIDLAARSRHRLMVRLVKGAYWDLEIKRAQQAGLAGYPVYTRKSYTDLAYLVCAQKLLAASEHVFPQFATHNARAVAQIIEWAKCAGVDAYEFQCLHGMGETLYDQLPGQHCRIYAPVGAHQTLLPYLVRRLLENGANSSFVNQMQNQKITSAALIQNPFERARWHGGAPHPALVLPRDLFGASRQNSAGIDLANEDALRTLAHGLARFEGHYWCAQPLLAVGFERRIGQSTSQLPNPARNGEYVGEVIEAGVPELEMALASARAGAAQWQALGPALRAQALLRGAALFETQRIELLALLLREAGKTLPNALAEVREAVDFLRYYAAQALLGPKQVALGMVACISPWNFPLAIFSGQIGAALACGNVVLAKPAEQTPLIAWRAVQLLHEAGIPRCALQFLPGRGEVIGATLCRAADVKAVLFTGSLEVAQEINRTLAQRAFEQAEELMLIAETGGQNAMIVDATALPEQVVQDILYSAFDSAGQRCSALRVLFLQQDIAEQIIGMLQGALRELTLGNPARLSTDIGPVIDDLARQALLDHIAHIAHIAPASGHQVSGLDLKHRPDLNSSLSPGLNPGMQDGTFVAPVLIEIKTLAELAQEVFGPVLHIIRFADDQLEHVIDDINRSGYGLTLGIHSRIGQTIDFISQHAHVGNIYVNRNMVGAVVGVQPFGGEGKSGTGPKAGGPLYLQRLQRAPPALAELEASCQLSAQNSAQGMDQSTVQPSPAAALAELLDWANSHGFERSAGLIGRYMHSSLPGATLLLPGPVGERNTLRFMPRGKILCVATSSKVLLNQLAAVFASGNQALVLGPVDGVIWRSLPTLLAARIIWCDTLAHCVDDFQVALLEALLSSSLKPVLAARAGALVVTLDTTAEDAIPLFRLLVERCLCINTSAAGGNTSLMTLPP